MSDQWNVYLVHANDNPASIFVDMGIAKAAPVAASPFHVQVRLKMLRPRDDGLSSQDDYEALIVLEDALTGDACTLPDTHYVGRVTSRGNRDFYFYTADGPAFEAAIRATLAGFASYRFQTFQKADPDWDFYFNVLYPSPPERQRMANRAVIENLRRHNDRTDQPRQIDHFAYFPDQPTSQSFVDFVRAEGFVVSRPPMRHQDGKFGVEFSKTGIPDNIDAITAPLVQDALDHGGDYDGWGCPVVT